MYLMDSPVDQEFKRRNSKAIAREESEEKEYKELKKYGIPCDGCSELFMHNELEEVELEDFGMAHMCKDC